MTSSKEHYISNAKTYDGKDPKEFNQWLESVSRLSRISGKDLLKVAMAISTGPLHRHISELMALGIDWDIIKSKIQERFGSPVVAQNKLTTFTQKTMAMHECISEFTSIIEYAYNIKPTEKSSHLLASNFIEGIQNPYIKNKLRSYTIENLSELFGFALKEDQKQKVRELDFGNSSHQQTIAPCDINVIKSNECYKCGNHDHFIKDCSLNKDNSYNHPNTNPQKNFSTHKNQRKPVDENLEQSIQTMTDLLKTLIKQTSQSHHTNNKPLHRHPTSKYSDHKQSFRHQRSHNRGHHHKSSNRNNARINEIGEYQSDCTLSCSDQSDVEEELNSQETSTVDDPKN